MKFFSPFLFLLCVSVLCITSTAGSYNHGPSLLLNAKMDSKGQPQPHSMHKRQDDSDLCQQTFADELCNNGFYQELADFYVQCNQTQLALNVRDVKCSQMSTDKYCSIILDISALDSNIQDTCASSTSTCTPECREILATARNLLGCCVNAFNGTTEVYTFLQYSLWSRCDVDLVTEECSSTITLPSQIDSTCNGSVLSKNLFNINCRRHYAESIRDRLATTLGCQNIGIYEDILERCAANELGSYCATESSVSEFISASENCQDTSTCNPNCTEALVSLVDTNGCCINFSYNDSSDGTDVEWLSYEFWSKCDLETPGICEARLNHATIFRGPNLATVLAVAMLLVVCI